MLILQKFSQLYQHLKGTDQKLYTALDTISTNFDTVAKSLPLTTVSIGSVNYQTTNYTTQIADSGKLIVMNGSSLSLFLPNPAQSKWFIYVLNLASSNLTINRNLLTINRASTNLTLGQNQLTLIFSDGSNYYALSPSNLSGLTTVNNIPKVVSAGILGASSLNDDGTEVYTLENFGVGTPTPSNKFQTHLATNLNVAISFLNSVAQLFSINDANSTYEQLYIDGNLLILNKFSGNHVLIGTDTDDSSGAILQAHGSVNVPTGSLYKINNVALSTAPLAQSNLGGSRVLGTVYQNTGTNPRFITVTISTGLGQVVITAITDSSSSPSTVCAQIGTPTGATAGFRLPVTFVVLPNNYYSVNSVVGTNTIQDWFEWQ